MILIWFRVVNRLVNGFVDGLSEEYIMLVFGFVLNFWKILLVVGVIYDVIYKLLLNKMIEVIQV